MVLLLLKRLLNSVFFTACLLCLASASFAARVDGLYAASVPVSSQQGKDRSAGFDAALREVLVKITGQRRVLEAPVYQSLLPAESLVQTYSYAENPAYVRYVEEQAQLALLSAAAEPESAAADTTEGVRGSVNDESLGEADEEPVPQPYLLDVSYAKHALDAKLAEYSVPVWGEVRPSVLLWLVRDDGERSLVGSSDEAFIGDLKDLASRYGLPLYFPVADLQDQSSIVLEDLWGLFPGTAAQADLRYQPDLSIMMRVYQSQSGLWSANWLLPLGSEYLSGERYDAPLQEVWDALVFTLSESLASRYAVLQSSSGSNGHFRLDIEGVKTFNEFIAVRSYLNGLPPVAAAQLEWVRGEVLRYELSLKGTLAQFYEYLQLDGRLRKQTLTISPQSYELAAPSELNAEPDALTAELPEASLLKTQPDVERFVWISGE